MHRMDLAMPVRAMCAGAVLLSTQEHAIQQATQSVPLLHLNIRARIALLALILLLYTYFFYAFDACLF